MASSAERTSGADSSASTTGIITVSPARRAIARLREEARLGNDPRKAADLAVEHGGPSVAAGLILAGTFASMMLGGIAFLTEMGFAVSIGIIISAFVMAMFLVPSLTALLGHKAWWPGHGDAPGGAAGPTREPETVDAATH
ncbi:hypothetical protein E1193_00895 [Micromonospora sp. KC606]|uniref:MMPL family transporter n=1 Tax=Micromonospora sp. KC606 TaxID=2530379 RepID=UPI001046A65B|nr:MMPL family transporter [Micromonospora sp. KC606]TDC86226.1 hypothetical protein E1193_00895 [Micromonospora sp. KC606]